MSDTTAVEYRPVLHQPFQVPEEEMVKRSAEFYALMNSRRSVRMFSDRPVQREVIENCVRTAGTAPSGANKQPWTFCVVESAQIKKQIRAAAEKEELQNYSWRMSEEWKRDLAHLGTDEIKEYLEIAPYLIVVFKHSYEMVNGERRKNYYINESVGIASGMLLAALQNAGLCTLTHTPSPMGFLREILKRPANETAVLLIPVGYPADGLTVPDISRKSIEQIMVNY